MSGYSTYERIVVALVGSVVLFFLFSIVHAFQDIPFEMESSVVVEATPEQIWPYIEEPEMRPVWQWRIIHVNSLTPTKMDVGSRQWLFYSYYESRWDGEEVVTQYEENNLWAASRTSTRTNASVAIGLKRLSDVKGKPQTKVTYIEKVLELEYEKRINFIFEGQKAQTHTENSLLRLKELVEDGLASSTGK